MENQPTSKQLFKMHIVQELNDLLKEWSWQDRITTGIQVSTNDITDQMVEQIEHAMKHDKQNSVNKNSKYRRQSTIDVYKEILYNDVLPNRE